MALAEDQNLAVLRLVQFSNVPSLQFCSVSVGLIH